jgi:hypothetical protein
VRVGHGLLRGEGLGGDEEESFLQVHAAEDLGENYDGKYFGNPSVFKRT